MKNLKFPLFFTRVSVFYFLLPWVLMRFSAPEKAKGIAAKYYFVSEMPDIINLIIGMGWLALLIAFLVGYKKRISYGLVFALHAIGTAFTLPYLIIGTSSMKILFFAAIPAAGAMWLLYSLRDSDTVLTIS